MRDSSLQKGNVSGVERAVETIRQGETQFLDMGKARLGVIEQTMRQLFREAQKVQDPSLQQGNQRSVERAAETIKQDQAQHLDRGKAPFSKCQKICIALPPQVPAVMLKGHESEKSAVESYRALRTRLTAFQSTHGVRSIVVTSAIQGEGKTLTALNLALCCARLNEMRVLLVDADLHTQGLTRLLGLPPTPGLGGILTREAEIPDVTFTTDMPNLYVVGARNPAVRSPELFAGPSWKEFVAWASESFNLVIFDAPPVLPLADLELMALAADGVLLVVRARNTQRELLLRAVKVIDPKKILGLVFNAAENGNFEGYDQRYALP